MTRVVLLHGFLGSPEAWGAVREILDARRPLGLEVVAPWLPGHGRGAAPLDDHTFDGAIDGFVASLHGRGDAPQPRVWAGYSMGGRIALGVAGRHPALVGDLVLVSSHLGLAVPEARAQRAADDDAFARLADHGIEAMVDAHASRSVLIAQNALPGCLRDVLRARRLAHDPHAIASSIRALGLGAMPDLRGVLAARGGRLHVVAGGEDPSYAALAREAARIAGAEATIVPGAGHDVLLEDPEPVAEAILRAVARAEDATAGAAHGRDGDKDKGTESHP